MSGGPSMSPFGKVVRPSRGDKGDPKVESPRCACGGMFPLDTHPVTGVRICAACYKKAVN